MVNSIRRVLIRYVHSNTVDIKDHNLPDPAIVLLKYMISEGASTQSELISSLDLPLRTIRYSLRRLKEEQFIRSKPDLLDMRSLKYTVNEEHLDKIQHLINTHQSGTTA